MRKLSVLIGTAVVGAIMLVAILTTATLAQGTGPGYMGPENDGRPRDDPMRRADHADAIVLTQCAGRLRLRPQWSRWLLLWNDAALWRG